MPEPQIGADGRPVFVIGITMAGAVSAGAYAAGVLDFLFRALAAHEAESARTGRGPKIVVKAISGTSAGGTTACLGVAGLIDGVSVGGEARTYFHAATARPEGREYRVGLPKLHDIWVEALNLTGPGGLLGTRDLDGDGPLLSLLDGSAIDRAADAVLTPSVWIGQPYGFVADPLDVFVTTTAMGGVVYEARFGGAGPDDPGHLMARHGLARHFAVEGLGAHRLDSAWLAAWGDAGVRLTLRKGARVDFDSRETLAAQGRPPTRWTEFRETGVATGAFPGGLSARFIRARMGEHGRFEGQGPAEGGAWPYDIDPALAPQPRWGAAEARGPGGDATYVAVDGGVVNNEPFEFARFAIRAPQEGGEDWALARNEPDKAKADRAVLMIDPFPEGPSFGVAWPEDPEEDARALPGLAGRIFGALVAQARFKPAELAAAMSDDIRSRQLIAPSRGPEGSRRRGAEAIAAGALGGFSGFFDKRFRQHDYILGQHNCQSFLRRHFTLPPGNPVMAGAPAPVQGEDEAPILLLSPELFGSAAEIEEPLWPRMETEALDAAFGEVAARLDAAFDRQIRAADPVWAASAALAAAWRVWGRDIALRAVSRRIEAGLLAHDLIEAELPEAARAPLGRRVLRALVAPGPPLRTARGLAWRFAREDARAAAAPLPEPPDRAAAAPIEAVLTALSTDATDRRYRTKRYEMRDGEQTWVIPRLGPGWARRNLPFLALEDDRPPKPRRR